MFNGTLNGILLVLVGNVQNLDWSIGLINSDNVLIFKFGNSKFDLKDNFVNN